MRGSTAAKACGTAMTGVTMEIDVDNIEQRPNVLLNRTEVRFRVVHTGNPTPPREALREALAELMSVKKDQVILDSISQEYGRNESICYAKVYKKKELAIKHEREHMLKRNNLSKPKKGADKPKGEGGKKEGEAKEEAEAKEEGGEKEEGGKE
jgi:ribosomal protein S24E